LALAKGYRQPNTAQHFSATRSNSRASASFGTGAGGMVLKRLGLGQPDGDVVTIRGPSRSLPGPKDGRGGSRHDAPTLVRYAPNFCRTGRPAARRRKCANSGS